MIPEEERKQLKQRQQQTESKIVEDQRQEIFNLKEQVMAKQEVIEVLSDSLSNKGAESAQLAEKLMIIKNQLIDSGTFDKRFLVYKQT